jgi:hypothetical protein
MAKTTLKTNLSRKFFGACLMLFVAGSCTYDYFEDETNFRLYVPQIERGEIGRFYVSFHRLDGRDAGAHVITREVSAPFDENESLRAGILKFKLPPGRYEISTFADYGDGLITVGEPFASSSKSVAIYDGGSRGGNVYTVSDTQPRALFLRNTQVYPIGHPDSETQVEANIDETCRFKGRIFCRFIDLPETITGVEITYGGLATHYDFDGVFRRFSDEDVIFRNHPLANAWVDGDAVVSDRVYPSAGLDHSPQDVTRVGVGEQVALQIAFYNGANRRGTAYFTSADLATITDPGALPTDENGDPVTELVLSPRGELYFTFKDFTVISISLEPWDDINTGGVTVD